MKEPIECEPELIPYRGPKNPPMPLATIHSEQSDASKVTTESSRPWAREMDFELISEITHNPDMTT